MKAAVIGSRNLNVPALDAYLPADVTEIISGGAKGVDSCARQYAQAHGLRCTEFLPEYSKCGRAEPLRRNMQIVDHAACVFVFWDGVSRGTRCVIEYCRKQHKPCTVWLYADGAFLRLRECTPASAHDVG